MGVKKCKKCGAKVKYPDGAAIWVLSYGDFVTNLMAFFVALLSFASFDVQKWRAASEAMSMYFGTGAGQMQSGASVGREQGELMNAGSKNRKLGRDENPDRGSVQAIPGWSKDLQGSGVNLTRTEEGYKITIVNSVLFDAGSSKLRPGTEAVLSNIRDFLTAVAVGHRIRFEGHADDADYYGGLAGRDDLTLSCERAAAVYRATVAIGVPRENLSVAGYGDRNPLPREKDETDEAWQARNRRVEILIDWRKP